MVYFLLFWRLAITKSHLLKDNKPYKETVTLYFKDNDSVLTFYDQWREIEKKLHTGETIDNLTIQKFINMLNNAMEINNRKKSDYVEQAKETALAIIDKHKQNFSFELDYHPPISFDTEGRVVYDATKKVSISERDLITHIYGHFHAIDTLEDLEILLDNQKELITSIAKWSKRFLTFISTSDTKNFPKPNKLHIICSCVLSSFGLVANEEEFVNSKSQNTYYTEFLAAQSRHLFKKAWNPDTKKT